MTALVVLAAAKGGKDVQAGLTAAAGATLQAATSSATQADAAARVKGQSWIDAAKTALSAVQRSRLAAWSASVPLVPRNEISSIWKQEIKLSEAVPAKRHGRGQSRQTQICDSAGSEISVLLFVQRRKLYGGGGHGCHRAHSSSSSSPAADAVAARTRGANRRRTSAAS